MAEMKDNAGRREIRARDRERDEEQTRAIKYPRKRITSQGTNRDCEHKKSEVDSEVPPGAAPKNRVKTRGE